MGKIFRGITLPSAEEIAAVETYGGKPVLKTENIQEDKPRKDVNISLPVMSMKINTK